MWCWPADRIMMLNDQVAGRFCTWYQGSGEFFVHLSGTVGLIAAFSSGDPVILNLLYFLRLPRAVS